MLDLPKALQGLIFSGVFSDKSDVPGHERTHTERVSLRLLDLPQVR